VSARRRLGAHVRAGEHQKGGEEGGHDGGGGGLRRDHRLLASGVLRPPRPRRPPRPARAAAAAIGGVSAHWWVAVARALLGGQRFVLVRGGVGDRRAGLLPRPPEGQQRPPPPRPWPPLAAACGRASCVCRPPPTAASAAGAAAATPPAAVAAAPTRHARVWRERTWRQRPPRIQRRRDLLFENSTQTSPTGSTEPNSDQLPRNGDITAVRGRVHLPPRPHKRRTYPHVPFQPRPCFRGPYGR